MLRFVTAGGADSKSVQVVQGIMPKPGAGYLIEMLRIAGGEFVDVYAQVSELCTFGKMMVVVGGTGQGGKGIEHA